MIEKVYGTELGNIHYFTNDTYIPGVPSLVFLPGLTADHRLFEKQISYFEGKYNVFVWDAPGHGLSRPFVLSFSLKDKAGMLREILKKEGIEFPVLIGQSMGGYVAQAYLQYFPKEIFGFVSIDSAPLQRQYVTAVEIYLLKRMEPVYRHYPWKSLVKTGSKGCAQTEYGRKLMAEMMRSYEGNSTWYARLAGHGYRMLAEAMEADLPYRMDCPTLLLCGDKDQAGSTKRYNKAWQKKSGLELIWIRGAGHNSNTDRPDEVNAFIDSFVTEKVLPEIAK